MEMIPGIYSEKFENVRFRPTRPIFRHEVHVNLICHLAKRKADDFGRLNAKRSDLVLIASIPGDWFEIDALATLWLYYDEVMRLRPLRQKLAGEAARSRRVNAKKSP